MPVDDLCRVFGQMKNNEAIAIPGIEGRSASDLSATGAVLTPLPVITAS